MSSATLDLHRMLVRVSWNLSGKFEIPSLQTLNFQLALITLLGIACAVYVSHLVGITEHPLAEVMPCAVSRLVE